MLLSRNRKFIFIHIYKNAGTSVTTALLPFTTSKWQRKADRVLNKMGIPSLSPRPYAVHIKASELINEIGQDVFDSFFSFAIVRNPWDWQVSLYNYMLRNTAHYQRNLVKDLGGFDEYIRWRCEEEVRFQKDFIYSEDGELLVDFVGRFERIDADFNTICSRIGISASLARLNVYNAMPYQQYYSEETKDLVRQTFKADITLFGYYF